MRKKLLLQIQKHIHSKESAEIAARSVTSALSILNQKVDAAAAVVEMAVVEETVEAT